MARALSGLVGRLTLQGLRAGALHSRVMSLPRMSNVLSQSNMFSSTGLPGFSSPLAARCITTDQAPMSEIVALNNIHDNPGARKKKLRLGRGQHRGKTSGRGHKGQNSRRGSGKPRTGFEGGQSPMYRRLPKRGFKNLNRIEFEPLNLQTLADRINRGFLDPTKPITMRDLWKSNSVGTIKQGVKLLAKGHSAFHHKVNIQVSRVSKSARKIIEENGGTVTTLYYNRLALRALLKPHKFLTLPRRASPPPRLQKYYPDHIRAIPMTAEQ